MSWLYDCTALYAVSLNAHVWLVVLHVCVGNVWHGAEVCGRAGVNWIFLLIPIPELESIRFDPIGIKLELPSFELELLSTEFKSDTKALVSLFTVWVLDV